MSSVVHRRSGRGTGIKRMRMRMKLVDFIARTPFPRLTLWSPATQGGLQGGLSLLWHPKQREVVATVMPLVIAAGSWRAYWERRQCHPCLHLFDLLLYPPHHQSLLLPLSATLTTEGFHRQLSHQTPVFSVSHRLPLSQPVRQSRVFFLSLPLLLQNLWDYQGVRVKASI